MTAGERRRYRNLSTPATAPSNEDNKEGGLFEFEGLSQSHGLSEPRGPQQSFDFSSMGPGEPAFPASAPCYMPTLGLVPTTISTNLVQQAQWQPGDQIHVSSFVHPQGYATATQLPLAKPTAYDATISNRLDPGMSSMQLPRSSLAPTFSPSCFSFNEPWSTFNSRTDCQSPRLPSFNSHDRMSFRATSNGESSIGSSSNTHTTGTSPVPSDDMPRSRRALVSEGAVRNLDRFDDIQQCHIMIGTHLQLANVPHHRPDSRDSSHSSANASNKKASSPYQGIDSPEPRTPGLRVVEPQSDLGAPAPSITEDSLICGTDGCQVRFFRDYKVGNRQRHIRNQHGGRNGNGEKYPCEEPGCRKEFNRTDARLKHYRKHHGHRSQAAKPRKNIRHSP